jgi:hypothetical protein
VLSHDPLQPLASVMCHSALLYVAGFSQSAGLTTDQTVRLQLYVSQTIEDALDAGYREGVSHRESG